MKLNRIVELCFAEVTLPVVCGQHGHDVVPLKPISDSFGLRWEDQRVRVQQGYLSQLLGTCTPTIRGAGQAREFVCIRVDRVAAWMFQINPERVRSAGNEVGADFLIQKHEEWAGVLHAYEVEKGGMVRVVHDEARVKSMNLRLYLAVLKEKRATNDPLDRKALTDHAKNLSAECGAPYQVDLISGDAP